MQTYETSKVYVKLNKKDSIIQCEGGYTTPSDLTGWVQIDEGVGDKYNLCQSHYFEGGLYTQSGTPRYKLVNGKPELRTEKEILADCLPGIKEQRIAKSKTDLAAYLAFHPLEWRDGEEYSITQEKQAQLTSKIMAATLAAQTSTPYTLTWNSTGEVCKEWTLKDLSALAFTIDARVTALVSYQQTQEVAMRNASTQEELDAIEVDYDSVQ
ncbi:MAG: hypothetical protein ACOX7N_08205 [Lawsonibacter sp.]|jgi:hypothetical protein